MTPSQFPLLRSAAPSPENLAHLDQAIEAIAEGVRTAAIRNVTWVEAKERISRAVYSAWSVRVQDRLWDARRGERSEEVSAAEEELYDSLTVFGLHDVLAANRRVEKSAVQGNFASGMRAFLAEVLPLAEAAASLKSKVVKGRVPSAPKPVNPNKVVKTCPCCFRAIAVVAERMAHHGYTRPRFGWQTASCAGVRFRPLEVSNEGLVWLIGQLQSQLAATQANYVTLGDRQSITVLKGKKLVEVAKGQSGWRVEFNKLKAELESDIRFLIRELGKLQTVLAAWVPQP